MARPQLPAKPVDCFVRARPWLHPSLALEQRAPSGSFAPAPAASSRTSQTTSLNDVELRATHTAWKSGPALVTERLTIAAGVKLPTAPLEHETSSFWSAWTGASLAFPR